MISEPANCFKDKIAKNRDCLIDYRAVHQETGVELDFHEYPNTGLSVLATHQGQRKDILFKTKPIAYKVQSISLEDLLKGGNTPKVIDYISIDTEGSEYAILENFPFDKYRFRVMTIESNPEERRTKVLRKLLESHGYKKFFRRFQQ